MIFVERYHDFSCGHRVVNHEGKCALLHGHNYRIHFQATARKLDSVGRVVDFSVLKLIGDWIEDHWDHRFLAWESDSTLREFTERLSMAGPARYLFENSLVWVPFNPTAENIGTYLMGVANTLLHEYGVWITQVRVEETRKCSAVVEPNASPTSLSPQVGAIE